MKERFNPAGMVNDKNYEIGILGIRCEEKCWTQKIIRIFAKMKTICMINQGQ